MLLDGPDTQFKNVRDLMISLAFRQPMQNFTLTRRERLVARQMQELRAAFEDPFQVRLEEFQHQPLFVGKAFVAIQTKTYKASRQADGDGGLISPPRHKASDLMIKCGALKLSERGKIRNSKGAFKSLVQNVRDHGILMAE